MPTRPVFASIVVATLACAGASAQTVYGLTVVGSLISFDVSNPGAVTTIATISGAGGSANNYLGIDFRTATSELYLLETVSQSKVYTLNTSTGAATLKSTLSTNLSGGSYGTDFNPVADRLRTTSVTTANHRTNVDTGAVTQDSLVRFVAGDPNFGDNPVIVGSAYTNSLFGTLGGTGATTLYTLDAENDVLVLQDPPNAGALTTIGAVGFDFFIQTGFDIYYNGTSNTAYASLTADGGQASHFYSIDLSTGAGTFLGTIGGGRALRDIAVIPAPGALVALGLAGVRRRR